MGRKQGVTRRAEARRVAERRVRVARLYLRYCREGNPHGVVDRIAKELGVHYAQISRDLQALDLQWQEQQQDTVARYKAEMVAALERDIAELREEWTRSRTDTPTEDTIEGVPTAEGKMQPDRMQRKKRSASADVRYQAAITAKQAELAKLVGAYAPAKVAPTDSTGDEPAKIIVEYVQTPLPTVT